MIDNTLFEKTNDKDFDFYENIINKDEYLKELERLSIKYNELVNKFEKIKNNLKNIGKRNE